MKKLDRNPRFLAVKLLERIEKNGSYSNLALNQTIKKSQLDERDVSLLTNIVYGVIQRKLTLEFYLDGFIKNRRKVEPWVYELLKTALYQQLYLDKIPKRAVFNETIEIAKLNGHEGIRRFVTGILHEIERKGLPDPSNVKDSAEKISIESSTPKWLVEKLTEELGFEKTISLLKSINEPPAQSIRVNLAKNTVHQAVSALEKEGFKVSKSLVSPLGLRVSGGFIPHSDAYKRGLVTVQDESAMLAVDSMDVESTDVVLDGCAAPGGKTMQIAAVLDSGRVYALDIHAHKVGLIEKNAELCGVNKYVTAKKMDARKAKEEFDEESFDKVLIDAPCSGLGLMRRKPEVKYDKHFKDSLSLHDVQVGILDQVAELVKPGGRLTYSTCTILNEENQATVDAFLKRHPEFYQIKTETSFKIKDERKTLGLTIYPDDFGSDGFFIATLMKREE